MQKPPVGMRRGPRRGGTLAGTKRYVQFVAAAVVVALLEDLSSVGKKRNLSRE